MKALLKIFSLQLLRSKVVWLILALFFLVEWAGISSMRSISIRYQGMFTQVSTGDILLVSLYLALFPIFMVSMVYGVWLMPYHHTSTRAPITYALPLERWKFPAAHSLILLAFFLVQVIFCFLVTLNAFPKLGSELGANWKGFISASSVLFLAFLFSTLFLAFFALIWGQMLSVLLYSTVCFLLQVGAAASRYDQPLLPLGDNSVLKFLGAAYPFLPPLGEILFDLREFFSHPVWFNARVGLWLVWTIAIAAAFTLRIGSFRAGR